MSEEIQITPVPKPSALAIMATRFSVDPAKLLETLKATAFKGSTDAELMSLCIVANEYGLNPFTKEIYAFPAKGGGIVPLISIDGWLKRINEHPQFDGLEKTFTEDDAGKPISCIVTIHRKDRNHPTIHEEYLLECARNTEPWNKQPRRMLGHRALIQCARIAFGFSGADPEEMEAVHSRAVIGRVIPQAKVPAFLSRPEVSEIEPATEEEGGNE